MPLVTFSNGSAADASDVNANFALCVLTDTAKTITVSHTWSAVQKFADGAVGSPGIQFSDDPDSGLYRIGANNIGVAVGGAKVLDISSSGLTVTGSIAGSIAATSIDSGTLPSARLSGSYTGITGVGTLTAGTWSATTIAVAKGGTGLTSFTAGDLLYATAATTLAKLAKGTALQILRMNAGATAPEWADPYGVRAFGPWLLSNISGTVSTPMLLSGSDIIPYWVAVRSGSVTGVWVSSSEARTAGTATVDVTINAVATGLQAQLNATDTQYDSATQASGTDTFSAGDRIGVLLTTSGWTPTTADLAAGVEVTS